ncbi:MAG: hypothetical protein HC915_09880 [Anaerolineae bacterium]|nr:hypothetical protein [Anaerolineae bacterium]
MASGKHLTPAQRFDELIPLIRSGDPSDRMRAIPYLARIDDARVPPILLDLLVSPLTDERAAIRPRLSRQEAPPTGEVG